MVHEKIFLIACVGRTLSKISFLSPNKNLLMLWVLKKPSYLDSSFEHIKYRFYLMDKKNKYNLTL